MIEPIKSLGGMVKAKLQRYNIDNTLTGELVRKIGPEGVIGMRNQATYTKKVGDMVKSGRQSEAVSFARGEAAKVRSQSRKRY